MLTWLKELVRPIYQQDPRFGKLRYLRDAQFWEGNAGFKPLGREVEVLISSSANGPSEQQRTFFDELERRYESLWPSVRERLATEARKLGEPDAAEFDLVSVDLPSGGDPEWALSYETRPPSWQFRVVLRDWDPREVIAER